MNKIYMFALLLSACGLNIPEHIEIDHNVPQAECVVETLPDGTILCYCTLGNCTVIGKN